MKFFIGRFDHHRQFGVSLRFAIPRWVLWLQASPFERRLARMNRRGRNT